MSVVDPQARDKYLLQVTAGPSYDPSTHEEVKVNGEDSTVIESDLVTCWLKVRIKDYHGLPHGSPATSPYFSHKLHASDRYSIAFSFVPKEDLSGEDIVMGFDYDHSIKHQLPPGFKYAMKIATTMLDPGLYSDPYSENPYLYGPALSGLFTLNIGELTSEVPAEKQLASLFSQNSGVVEEGATGSGQSIRDTLSLPPKWKKRRKHFLTASNLENFTFEKGRMYHADFFNPYLDFANFSLRLPGFSISIARYIDEKTHHLRFVVKNRASNVPLFVVFFRLLFGKELEDMLESREGEKKGMEQKNGDQKKTGTKEGTEDDSDDGASFHSMEENAEHGSEVQNGAPKGATNGDKVFQAKSPSRPSLERSDSEPESGGPTAAVTSLANSLYSAIATMSFRDDSSSSSSEDEAKKAKATPSDSKGSTEAQIDDMNDATVAKFLQSKNSNV